MRDLPSGAALLALGRETLVNELLPLVPPERHRELRLVATAIAIAEREAIAGDGPAHDILCMLQRFYEDSAGIADVAAAPHPDSLPASGEREGPAAKRWEGEGLSTTETLLHRLAADLRNGAFERCDRRERAARAIIWRLTIWKLREGNPQFLAENGFGE